MTNLLRILSTLGAVALCFTLNAQTGPGGVGDNSNVALWLDAHTMGGANGATVSTWTDYSGNGINATEADVNDMPFFSTNALNGRHAIDFQGSQCLTTGANAIMDNINQFKFYVIGNMDNIGSLTIPFNVDYGSSSADAVITGLLTQSSSMDVYGRKYGSLIRADISNPTGLHAYAGEFDMNAGQIIAETDFSQDDVNPNLIRNTSTHEEFWIGGTKSFGSSNYFIDGQLGEVIVFTSTLNAAQQNILENYLSAKFGMAATTDMYTFEAGHGLGVIGIGREDATNEHTNSIGNGYVRISTPSSLSNGDYLFAGHDDVAIGSLSANVPAIMPVGTQRFERQWRVEKTGDLGTVTIVFELDASSNFSADPSTYTLVVDTDADFSNATETYSGAYNAGAQTVTFTNVDFTTGEFFTLAGDGPGEIISVQNGNWGDPTTWDCNCIPTCFNDVSLDIGHTVTVDEDAFAKYFFLDFNSTLVMNAEFDLTICEDFEIDGAVDLTAGKIVMAGSADQLIDPFGNPMTLHDLEINNTTGSVVTLVQSEYTLQGSLLLESGDLVVDNGPSGILIVDSQSGSTGGRIGQIKPGCSITGNVRVLRFLPAGDAGWRNVCSPVTNADLTHWDATMVISGDGFPDGCANNGSGCFYSVKQWIGGVSNDITSITAPLENGVGYEMFVGDDLSTWSGGTLQVEGILNNNSSLPVTVTNDWNTQGNPYASPILFSTVNRNHVDNYFYIYDASTGGYQWYDGASNTSSIPSLANGLIATGQAFWTFDWGTLTYEQTDKVDQSATFIKASEEEDFSMYLKLSENNSTYSSTIAFEQNEECLDGFDTIRDMRHLIVGDEKCPGFAIETTVDLLRKNWINTKVETKSYDLFTEFKNDGYYTLEAKNVVAFDNYQVVKLFDKLMGDYIDLKKESSIVFYAEQGLTERFTLILSNELETQETPFTTASIEENGVEITQMGNVIRVESGVELGENVMVNLYNLAGQQMVYTQTLNIVSGTTNIELPAQKSGVYILTINNGEQQISKKLVF